MNKFQRATAGIKGSVENAVDDIRHEYERAVWGRKTTGDVNMFPADSPDNDLAYQTPDNQEPDMAEIDNDMEI